MSSFTWPDFTNFLQAASSGSNNTLTLPTGNAKTALSSTPNNFGDYWYISVVGAPVYIAYGASAATSASACVPVGMTPVAIKIPAGTVVNFITTSGSGIVSLIKANVGI